MRILHVPFCFHPDPVGGTEIYVEQLCHSLEALGAQTIIATPASKDADYVYEGLQVRRFATTESVNHLRELYDGIGDPLAAERFTAILEKEQPDIVHFHAFNRAASLRMISAAKARGISTVFTYHLPGVSCQRGTLLRWGEQICAGELKTGLCASCSLHDHGLRKSLSLIAGHTPQFIGLTTQRLGLAGGGWTALQMTSLIKMRHAALRQLMTEIDAVITLCSWSRELLIRNGMDRNKIVLSRHGITYNSSDQSIEHMPVSDHNMPLRIAFIGRLYPIKGPDLLIEGLRHFPTAQIHLDLYSVVQDEASSAYLRQLHDMAGCDPRISFHLPVSNNAIISLLSTYDFLAVPSQCLETGPLVVLEAFAAGIPVLGSRLGGIAELVHHDIDGLLIDYASAKAWGKVLQDLASDRERVNRLRKGVRSPRSMKHVASEMLELYQLLKGSCR